MTTLEQTPTALTHIAGAPLVEARTEAHRLNAVHGDQTAQFGPLDYPTTVLPQIGRDGDPLGKVNPGTWAAVEAGSPHHTPLVAPTNGYAGALSMFGLSVVVLVVAWMFMGTPNLADRWPSLLILLAVAGLVLLPLRAMNRAIRSTAKGGDARQF